jgi:5'-methylthioadenosine phosphorylase
MAHPTCRRVAHHLVATGTDLGLNVVQGGTYVVMEGPQFSSLAESELHRSWQADVIGMTNMPEAKLAREAELCYATVAMVTDFDCWHPDHDHVKVEDVVAVMHANSDKVRKLIATVVPRVGADAAPCPHGCDRALEMAIMTAPDARDPDVCKRLDAVAGRVLRPGGQS